MTEQQSIRLNKIMIDIRKTLDAEMEGFEAYVVTPKRLDVAKLLGDTLPRNWLEPDASRVR